MTTPHAQPTEQSTSEWWTVARAVADDLDRCVMELRDAARPWTEADAEQVDALVMVLDDLESRAGPASSASDDGELASLYESPLSTNALADAVAELSRRASTVQEQAWERAGRPIPMFVAPAPILARSVVVKPVDVGRVEVPLESGDGTVHVEPGGEDVVDEGGDGAPTGEPVVPTGRRTDRWAVAVEVLTVVGVLVLVFVVYAVWGTGLSAAQSQRMLEREFDAELRGAVSTETDAQQDSGILGGATAPPGEEADDGAAADEEEEEEEEEDEEEDADDEEPVLVAPDPGDPVAVLDLPTIGSRQIVVEGTRAGDLRSGPGHLRSTAQPGRAGNSVVFGRRTTFGGPFSRLDELRPGDPMDVVTTEGVFRYVVQEVRQVESGDPDPVGNTFSNRLTLVTSNEEYTTSGRLVAIGLLDGAPVPTPSDADGNVLPPPLVNDDELGTQRTGADWAWAVLWTQLLLAAYFGTKWLYRRWLPWSTWLVSGPVFVLVALAWLDSLARLFPSTL